MTLLVKSAGTLFVLVSLLTWTRWLESSSAVRSAEGRSVAVPIVERRSRGVADVTDRNSGGELPTVNRAGPAQSTVPANAEPEDAAVLEELSLGLTMGFTRNEALALARGVELDTLATFFTERSHINRQWLHRNGLPEEHLRDLYARWAAGANADERASVPGDIVLSRHSPRHDGGPYRVQSRFQAQDRTVFLHYTVPDDYAQASVVIRWLRADGSGPNYFDYHPLTAGPDQRQEAWARPANGWEPGTYRVEIFSTNDALTLLARKDYQVLP